MDETTNSIVEYRIIPEYLEKISEEGKIWLALWGGWAVTRLDPAPGEELDRLELPVSQVTACSFGGPALDELYITSANKGLSEEELAKQPHAGSLFKAKLSVTGTEFTKFAG